MVGCYTRGCWAESTSIGRIGWCHLTMVTILAQKDLQLLRSIMSSLDRAGRDLQEQEMLEESVVADSINGSAGECLVEAGAAELSLGTFEEQISRAMSVFAAAQASSPCYLSGLFRRVFTSRWRPSLQIWFPCL